MKKEIRYVFTIVISILLISGCSEKEVNVINKQPNINKDFIIAGSGSNLPITGKLIELYNQNNNEKVQLPKSIGSKGGIKAVKEGVIDIGIISRPLKENELKESLKQLSYARIGVVIGTNYDVPDNNIAFSDLVKIYQGKKTQWLNGKMIIVLTREEGDSSNTVLVNNVPGFEQALKDSQENRRWQVYFTDLEMNQAIMKTSAAIGLTDTGALIASKVKIKPLKINGVEPTTKNVQNGTYKLYKDLYFVYKEPLSERAKQFFDLVFSKAGERIISINGGIPLKR